MIVFSTRGRDGVRQLRLLPGNELAARTGTGLCVWDLDTRELRIDEAGCGLTPFLFAPDGRSVVAYSYRHPPSRGLGVYSLAKASWVGAPLREDPCHFLLWSPSGQTLMLGDDSFTYVPDGPSRHTLADAFYRVADGQPAPAFLTRRPATGHGERLTFHRHAAISPDGRRAVTYSSGTLHVYDLVADRFVTEITLPILDPKPGLFTPDGSRFLVWSVFKIYAIDLDAGKVVLAYPACPRAVHGATLTPDGRHLLQVSAGRTVRVLDVATGRLVKDYAWSAGKLDAVAVSPDGLLAACGGSGGKVVVWDLDL